MVISTIKLSTPAPAPAPIASPVNKATTLATPLPIAQPAVTAMATPVMSAPKVTTSLLDGMKTLTSANTDPALAPVPAPEPAPAPAPSSESRQRHMNYVDKALGWRNYLIGTVDGDDYFQGPGGATITGKEIDRRIENKKKYGIEDPSLLDRIIIGIFG